MYFTTNLVYLLRQIFCMNLLIRVKRMANVQAIAELFIHINNNREETAKQDVLIELMSQFTND